MRVSAAFLLVLEFGWVQGGLALLSRKVLLFFRARSAPLQAAPSAYPRLGEQSKTAPKGAQGQRTTEQPVTQRPQESDRPSPGYAPALRAPLPRRGATGSPLRGFGPCPPVRWTKPRAHRAAPARHLRPGADQPRRHSTVPFDAGGGSGVGVGLPVSISSGSRLTRRDDFGTKSGRKQAGAPARQGIRLAVPPAAPFPCPFGRNRPVNVASACHTQATGPRQAAISAHACAFPRPGRKKRLTGPLKRFCTGVCPAAAEAPPRLRSSLVALLLVHSPPKAQGGAGKGYGDFGRCGT
jgi:hypothetical protein